MQTQFRIGLIVPSSNCLSEQQFHRYAPAGIDIQVTRLRMTGKWHKPVADLERTIAEASAALSDAKPDLILFNCTGTSMEEGLEGEARIRGVVETAGSCPALTTSEAINEALKALEMRALVLISPYAKATNLHEIAYLEQAGFKVVHDFALGLGGGQSYIAVPPARWNEIVLENLRSEADGYFLSCTNTTMIETIDDLERRLEKPVVTSNQAALWACLKRLKILQPIVGLGKLFDQRA
jgi:maleate cis-trans isomerase